MGTYQVRNLLKLTTGVALFIASSYAMSATSWSYNLSTDCLPNTNSGTYAATCNVSTNPDLELSGWSTNTGSTTSGSTFAAAKIYDWGSTSGLGVVAIGESSSSTGPHAVDNRYGTDAILLRFTDASGQDQKVDLESVKIGWNGSDNPGTYDSSESSDISILAYTGTIPPSPNMNGANLANLTSTGGWTLVGHYGQVGLLTNNTATINTTTTSSWWLISAYNVSYGNEASKSGKELTSGNDYFKLLSVAGQTVDKPPPGKVSEPAAFLLMGTAMIGMMGLRRRRQIQH